MKCGVEEEKKMEEKNKIILGVTLRANGVSYIPERVIGHGSFGVVCQAVTLGTGETVAIKKVLQDRRFKNRELQIMRLLNHPNIVMMKNSFYTSDIKDELYLNLVLDYVPETVYRVCRYYRKMKKTLPMIFVKLYTYQLARALAYIHSMDICHRDIKPQNLLLDPHTGVLKLCDFGSAKVLIKEERNVAYICSRYYRAPELVFGASDYTTQVDVWSLGCVLAELLLMTPLFPGNSGLDQIFQILKILGTPSRAQILILNNAALPQDYQLPAEPGIPWDRVFRPGTPVEAVSLISQLLVYEPQRRLKPIQVCAHPFFDELRDPSTRLPNGRALPDHLFTFTAAELGDTGLYDALVPSWATASTKA